jgi:RNAse (barnase) inhibitor barstar
VRPLNADPLCGKAMIVRIKTQSITDWSSFHNVFAQTFGFPDYYGRNMDAWIDCMTYLNDPEGTDTAIQAKPGEVVVLHLEHVVDFRKRCPAIYDAIIECSAFVNYRQIETGNDPVLALSFFENAELVDETEGKKF